MTGTIEKDLKNWLIGSNKIVVVGIGNPIRADDYVGLYVVEQLKGKLANRVLLIEAETVPENYLLDIEEFKPTHVILIDAAFLGLKPAEVSLVEAEKIVDYSAITTHLLPLRVFCEYVKQATGATIALLLIEPQSMEYNEGLTPKVQATAKKLIKILMALLV